MTTDRSLLLVLLALALALSACDTTPGTEERPAFTCEVPQALAAPNAFLSISYRDALSAVAAHQVVAGTVAEGVTDTLWTYEERFGHYPPLYADYHPEQGAVFTTLEDAGGSERWGLRFHRRGGDTSTFAYPDGDFVYAPRWRPDGRRVLFGHYHSNAGRPDFVELDPETGQTRTVVVNAGGFSVEHTPAYSPDGGRVAYVIPSSTHGDAVHVADLGGVPPIRLGESQDVRLSGTWGPVMWSPDGAWVVSRGERRVAADSARAGVFAARADGSEVVEVAPDSLPALYPVGWVSAGCLVVLDAERHVHLADLHGNSRRLSAEPVPRTFRRAPSQSYPSLYTLVAGGGRMAAVVDDPGSTSLAVVDLAPFTVQEVPLEGFVAYRIAGWIEP